MSDDIASPRKRYSNWLMGNSHASPQGVASKRSHLPGGRVVLTGPGSAPVVLFFVFFPPSLGRGSSCSSAHSLSAAVLVWLFKINRQVGVSILVSKIRRFDCHTKLISQCFCFGFLLQVRTTCRTMVHLLKSAGSGILIRLTLAVCWLSFDIAADCVPHPFDLVCWQMSASLWP